MKLLFKALLIALLAVFTLTGCLTAKRLDKFVAKEYNDELPKPNRKQKVDISVSIATPSVNSRISTTKHKTDNFLPLIVYWQFYHRQACSLNNAIALTSFTNTINSNASKALESKLGSDKKLELTIEQVPSAFAIVLKENIVWVVYAFSWSKVYVEPDKTDLVVNYKLTGAEPKTGTITIKNTQQNKGIRFFQSWKSATSEHLADYNTSLTSMSKAFINQLVQEL